MIIIIHLGLNSLYWFGSNILLSWNSVGVLSWKPCNKSIWKIHNAFARKCENVHPCMVVGIKFVESRVFMYLFLYKWKSRDDTWKNRLFGKIITFKFFVNGTLSSLLSLGVESMFSASFFDFCFSLDEELQYPLDSS